MMYGLGVDPPIHTFVMDQGTIQKLDDLERGILAVKRLGADPKYYPFLDEMLAQVRVAKSPGAREFIDKNYQTIVDKYFKKLQQITIEVAMQPDAPAVEKPPAHPVMKANEPNIDLSSGFISPELQFLYQSPADRQFISQVASSSDPSTELTTPGVGRTSAFLTPDQIAALIGSMFEGYSAIQKAKLTAQIQAQQMQGKPVQAPVSMIQQAKQSTTPWGLIAVVGLSLVGLGLLLSSGSKSKTAEVVPVTVPVTVA